MSTTAPPDPPVTPADSRRHVALRWAPLVAALVIAVAATAFVAIWQNAAVRARSQQLVLVRLNGTVNALDALEWKTIATGRVTEELRGLGRKIAGDVRTLLGELREIDPDDPVSTHALQGPLTAYGAAVRHEFRILDSGRPDTAMRYHERAVDAAFDRVHRLVSAAEHDFGDRADAARTRATVTSALVLGVAALLIGVLLWRFVRSRRRLIALRIEDAAVRRSELAFRTLAQNASDLVAIIDRDGVIRYHSDSIERILGYRADEVVGRHAVELVHPDDLPGLASRLPPRDHPLGDVYARIESRLRHRDGQWIEMETIVSRLGDDGEDAERILLTSRDVSERKSFEEQLRHQAFHDALTGLPNRALFEDRVAHALAVADSEECPVAVLFADLDDFKLINDSLGHGAGDDLLRIVAQRLRAGVRGQDTAARLGGDEFAVLLEDAPTAAHATAVATALLETLTQPVDLAGRQITPRVSVGIAGGTSAGGDATALMRNADVAMYAAKRSTESDYMLFDPAMHTSAVRRFELSDDLDHALADEQFELHYQPLVELASGEIIGAEALLRWNHPREGRIAPLEFIPLAERSGAIVPIGRWALRQAACQAGRWNRDRPADRPVRVGVNLSPRQLTHPDLVGDVRDAIRDAHIRPDHLTIEITESMLVADVEETRRRLEELKALGVVLAVDDFGTGYSALSYLQRFPFDVLKIDKSFIDAIDRASTRHPLVQAIVDLGRSLGMDIVAEGIERPEQTDVLSALGANYGQGFHYSRPVPADELTAMLAASGDGDQARILRPSGSYSGSGVTVPGTQSPKTSTSTGVPSSTSAGT